MVFDFIFLKIIFKLFYSLASNVYDSVLYITIHNDKMSICTPSTQLIYKDLSFYVHLNSSVCLSKLFVIWQLRHITNLISSYFFQTFYFRHTSHYLICIHYLTVKLLTYNFIYFLTSLCGSQCELKFNFRNIACHIAKFSSYVFLKEYVSASPHNNFY